MDTLRFTEACRTLGAAARSLGLAVVPAFRSPPRKPGVDRTLRRYEGGAVISVVLRDRRDSKVIVDLVEGILAANDRPSDQSTRELLLEAALDACERQLERGTIDGGRPDPLPTRSEVGLKPRMVVETKRQVDVMDPPCNDDPADFEPF